MIGNSSSGIVEAASFKMPVVNIEIDKKGKFSENVIQTSYKREDIKKSINSISDYIYQKKLKNLKKSL